ncbi:MAG: mechanosensitive ion channel [Hadesarchaea archaeon]|nr:mechanosensitive ion channel [Hadesarchaea archaeon]
MAEEEILVKIVFTVITLTIFVAIWRFIKLKKLLLKARELNWILTALLLWIGLWTVSSIWGLITLLTSAAFLSVLFFFFMWYTKDLFFDSFFAGIKLTALGKLKPGDRIKLLGEEYIIEEIGITETILKSDKGLVSVPNFKIAQEAIVYISHEKTEKESLPSP